MFLHVSYSSKVVFVLGAYEKAFEVSVKRAILYLSSDGWVSALSKFRNSFSIFSHFAGCFRRSANVTKHHQFSVRKNIRLPGKLMTADCLLFNPRRVVPDRAPDGAKNQIAQQLFAFRWKTIPSANHYALRFHKYNIFNCALNML